MGMYLAVDAVSRRVVRGEGRTETDPRPMPRDGLVFYRYEGRLSFSPPSPTSVLNLEEGEDEPVWVETASLADLVLRAIDQIDSAADVARQDVIAKQTNTEEYRRAEQQAREHAAAGYPVDDVPSCVASWAKAKRREAWTGKDAADDIIATADRWYGLLDMIRELRLCAKEDVRHAADAAEVGARAGEFAADLSNLMKGLA